MKKAFVSVLVGLPVSAALGCDLCNIYSALEAHGEAGKGWHVSVAEQFTRFRTLQQDSHEVPNDVPQKLDSSITQFVFGYNFNEIYGVQFNLPLIHRTFQRPDGLDVQRGSVTGIGDASLLAHARLFKYETKDVTAIVHLLAGIKFPTGDSSRLHEEVDELTAPPPPPGAVDSGIHGHDLALGSGSVDGIVGANLFARCHRVFVTGSIQYAIRSEGSYQYKYANDTAWSTGPGVFLVLGEDFTCSLQGVFSGESKGMDRFWGMPADDTAISSVFAGPQINVTWKDKLSAEFGVDIPVSIRNTSLQLVPDWRVRGGLTWRF